MQPQAALKMSEACACLGIERKLMRKLAERKKVKAWRTEGGHWRFDPKSIEAYKNRSSEIDIKVLELVRKHNI